MNKIIIIVGLVVVFLGFYIGFSESYTSYYNVDTGQFQSYGNPSTVVKTFYPNSWMGTVVCVIGIMIFLSAILMESRKTKKIESL